MTIRNRPDYGVYYITLTNAGQMDVPAIGSRVVLAAAWEGASMVSLPGGIQSISGGQPSAASVNCQIGKSLGDAIGLQIGSKVNVENKFDFVRLSWPAQSGVIAEILISDDADGNGVDVSAAPTVALGQMSLVDGGNTALISSDGLVGVSELPNARAMNRVGDSFANYTNSNGVVTVVAPASNINGLIVRGNSVLATTAAAAVCLAIGAVAPTNSQTNEDIMFANTAAATPGIQLGHDIFVPPGDGLYLWSSAAVLNVALSYKVL
ncbi:MAG TPA: hypothetical protein VGL83_08085 [Stellaceae bacterium]|jgi:hypothetical protein